MNKCLILLLVLFHGVALDAQHYETLQSCEARFLKNNLQLLAAHYKIDEAKAATIQARIWELPIMYSEVNAWNPEGNIPFDMGVNGQKTLAVQQLIYLGGKKKKEFRYAQNQVLEKEVEFQEVLRNLRAELRKNFYDNWFDGRQLALSNLQISHIDSLVKNYQVQAAKGNVAYRDLFRLQTLLLQLKSDRTAVIEQRLQSQQVLKLLLSSKEEIVPVVEDSVFSNYFKHEYLIEEALIELALAHRPDFELAKAEIRTGERNLDWQRSLAIPDVYVGSSYDQRGGAFTNQVNLTLGMPLPLWNKNRGNIELARASIQRLGTELEYKQATISEEVIEALHGWREARNTLNEATLLFDEQKVNDVYLGVIYNFQNRNIGLLEFTDFMESYSQSALQFNAIYKAYILQCEELNTVMNQIIF